MELTLEQENLYKWYANGFLKRSNEYGDKQELTFFEDGFFVMNSETGEKSSQTIHKDLTTLLQKQLPFTVLSLNQQTEEREFHFILAEKKSYRFACMFIKEENRIRYNEGLIADNLTLQLVEDEGENKEISDHLNELLKLSKIVLMEQKENRMYAVTGMLKFEQL